MRKFNMAIVGLGSMGNTHRTIIVGEGQWYDIPIGGPIENLNIVGSYDIREERQQFAREHGLRAYASYDELLADPQIDFITCATQNDAHKEVIIRALRAGKGAVSEKPATLSSGDLQDMIDVANETGKVFTVHQNRRWDDDYVTVKKLIGEGYLGKLLRIESRVPGVGTGPGGWRSKAEHGGGYLFDWGVHILDQALDMFPGKVKTVYARLTHYVHQEVDDGFHIELCFDDGLVYYLEGGNSNFIQLPRWYVMGMEGTAVVDDFHVNGKMTRISQRMRNNPVDYPIAGGTVKIVPRRGSPLVTEPLPVIKADIRDFYRNVMDAVDGKAEIIVKPEQVMRVMKLMEAVKESDRTHSVVAFE